MNGGALEREDEGNKDASRRKRRRRRRRRNDDVNKWKSSAGHVSRRGVRQVSTGRKTNDDGASGNVLLIGWSGGCWEFKVSENRI